MSTTGKNYNYIPLFIILFVIIAQFTMNLYLPSLPDIAEAFHVSMREAEATLSVYLISFGASQLLYGPLSDYFGRKKILLIGIIIVFAGNFLALISSHMTMLLISRVIQGLGSGSIMVLGRTILRDCFNGKDLIRVLSLLAMILATTPALAPFIGGHLHALFGWRMNFLVMTIYTLITFFLLFMFMPETNQRMITGKISLRYILRNYYYTVKTRVFLLYTLCLTLVFAFQVIYLVSTPFIYQNQLGVSADVYGTLMVLPALGYFCGNYFSVKLLKKYFPHQIMLIGIFIILIDSILLLIFSRLGYISITTLTGALVILMFGSGCLYANCLAGTLEPFTDLAGTAAALSGAIQMIAAAAFSGTVDFFNLASAKGLGIYFFIISMSLSVIFIHFIYSKKHVEHNT